MKHKTIVFNIVEGLHVTFKLHLAHTKYIDITVC